MNKYEIALRKEVENCFNARNSLEWCILQAFKRIDNLYLPEEITIELQKYACECLNKEWERRYGGESNG